MKKIVLFMLTIAVFIPNVCFANYFDNQPRRYAVYASTTQYKSYADLKSVAVQRYDPPIYIIDITTYSFDYVNQWGMVKINRYFYNMDTQTVLWQLINVGKCGENGYIDIDNKPDKPVSQAIAVERYSPSYIAADLAFMKAYKMHFDKELQRRMIERGYEVDMD